MAPHKGGASPQRPIKGAPQALAAVGDGGRPVDWWFAYKVPGTGGGWGHPVSGGAEYAYADSASGGALARSQHRLPAEGAGEKEATGSALRLTLQQLGMRLGPAGSSQPPPTMGWVLYNDDTPGDAGNNGSRGHCKGVLAWDLATDSAFWMVHSIPNFPAAGSCLIPREGLRFGQTILCVTLRSAAEAERLGELLRAHHEPQVYGCRVPQPERTPQLALLAKNNSDRKGDEPCGVTIRTRGGTELLLLAKDRHWKRNFWVELVAPRLGVNLKVQTWRRLTTTATLPPSDTPSGKHRISDVQYVDFSASGWQQGWPAARDHSKVAVADGAGSPPWVIVADLNRMTSQQKRGGGAVCLKCERLAGALRSALLLAEPTEPVYPPPPTVPGQEQDRPVCPQCGSSFASKQTLSRHLASRTACKGRPQEPVPPRPSTPLVLPPKPGRKDDGCCKCCVVQ
eukprot:TRINITY_DN9416_c0_g1_i1.p1 TRINITY_DN9416_c0_g1~~TRINITY_DN9416_c0_g1_i1.p1  ORF type:complete len:477 (+),score=106.24 TRINITY_DN9416_c0_g1_i1:72-1433(+)